MSAQLLWIEAQKEFESFWPDKEQWCYAFEDTREAIGNTGKTRKVFTKGRPSDFLVVDHGVTFFAEVKSSQDLISFNLNNVEQSQWMAAIRSVAAGGYYFFFIRSEALGRWYMVSAKVMIEQRKTKKSIKWTELEPYFFRLKHSNGH